MRTSLLSADASCGQLRGWEVCAPSTLIESFEPNRRPSSRRERQGQAVGRSDGPLGDHKGQRIGPVIRVGRVLIKLRKVVGAGGEKVQRYIELTRLFVGQ